MGFSTAGKLVHSSSAPPATFARRPGTCHQQLRRLVRRSVTRRACALKTGALTFFVAADRVRVASIGDAPVALALQIAADRVALYRRADSIVVDLHIALDVAGN